MGVFMNLKNFNKILVIVSTNARKYRTIKKKIKEKLYTDVEKHNVIIKLTKNIDSNKLYTKDFVQNNTNSLIISVGGDGSISEVVEAIYKYGNDNIYFAFIPNGTGNDFSRAIYPKMSQNDIINKIDKLNVKKIDLIKINDKTSINVAAFGFESVVLENSLKFKKKFPNLAKISFLAGIFMSLNKLRPIKYKYIFKYSDASIKTGQNHCIMNAICNSKYYGQGFLPAPNASITDGIIDYNYIDYVGVSKLLSLMGIYKTEKHMDLDISHNLKLINGKIATIDDKEIIGNIDGNLYKFKEMKFETLPKVINLVIFG